MAVEGVEGGAVVGFVFEDDGGAVVEVGSVVAEAVDNAVKGSVDGFASVEEEVEADVDGAPFGQFGVATARLGVEEHGGAVDFAGFVVTADSDIGSGIAHVGEQLFGEGGGCHGRVEVAEEGAADGEIEDEFGGGGEVELHDGADAAGVGLEPGGDFGGLGAGGEAAGVAEAVVGEAGGDGG